MDHCYISDPACPSQQTTDETSIFFHVYVGVAVVLLIAILTVFFLRRFLRKIKEKRGMDDKSILITYNGEYLTEIILRM